MKKVFIVLVMALMSLGAQAQEYSRTYTRTAYPYDDMLTPNATFSIEDGYYTLSGVDSVPGKSSEELFMMALEWIGKRYKNPDAVIEINQKPSLLVIKGQIGEYESSTGRLELKFKEGKYRWTIDHLKLISPVEQTPRYAKERGQKWFNVDFRPFVEDLRKAFKVEDDW
jgi:hypothetical protein